MLPSAPPFPPLSPGQAVRRTVVQDYTISGSVTSFDEARQISFLQALSTATGVAVNKISLTLQAASVLVVVTFESDSDSESSTIFSALILLSQSPVLCSTLGVAVERVGAPVTQVAVHAQAPPSPSGSSTGEPGTAADQVSPQSATSDSNMGAIGALAGAIALLTAAVVYLFLKGRRERERNPSPPPTTQTRAAKPNVTQITGAAGCALNTVPRGEARTTNPFMGMSTSSYHAAPTPGLWPAQQASGNSAPQTAVPIAEPGRSNSQPVAPAVGSASGVPSPQQHATIQRIRRVESHKWPKASPTPPIVASAGAVRPSDVDDDDDDERV